MSEDHATLLRRAVGLHQRGEIDEAEALYRQVLDVSPDHPDALHFLGLAALQRGRPEEAIRLIGRAAAIAPGRPHFHSNLGAAYRAAGDPAEALRCYDRAIALAPTYADAFNNRGVTLEQLGRLHEALASYDQAVTLQPNYAEAFYNRGNVLKALRRRTEALASYDRAIELRPRYDQALNNRGTLLHSAGRRQEALADFEAVIALRPDDVGALYNRANILRETGREAEAAPAYEQVLALRPDYFEAWNNCGSTWLGLNRPEAALACFQHAATLRPDLAEASNNVATALMMLNRHEEALACCHRAIRLRPDYPEAHMNRGMCRLAMGDFPDGWRDYEWRWQVPAQRHHARAFRQRSWVDVPGAIGQTILLHAEQGFGDTLQFCRYVPLVAARGPVVLEVPAPLRRLLTTLDSSVEVVARGDALPPFDLHCPLLSVPLVLGTTVETIPAATPYLHADPATTEIWRRRLRDLPGLRVGLVWAGQRRPVSDPTDLRRSMSLHQFAPLAAIPGVSLVSLQLGAAAAALAEAPEGLVVHDWTAELTDFADTAALVAALDLVVSVDTAVAHLAGALARPVWILSRFDACWRWLVGRHDSPWYPTARVFSQPSPGDWESVVARVCAALRDFAAAAAEAPV